MKHDDTVKMPRTSGKKWTIDQLTEDCKVRNKEEKKQTDR